MVSFRVSTNSVHSPTSMSVDLTQDPTLLRECSTSARIPLALPAFNKSPCQSLNGHRLPIHLSRVHLLPRLLDLLKDGSIFHRVVRYDVSGLVF